MPVALQIAVGVLRELLEPVARGEGSAELVALAARVVEEWQRGAARAEGGMFVLESIMAEGGNWPDSPLESLARARDVTALLALNAHPLPASKLDGIHAAMIGAEDPATFLPPDLQTIAKKMQGTRIAVKGKQGGGMVTPWGAAKIFAAAAALPPMPKIKSAATRTRKTTKRRKPNSAR